MPGIKATHINHVCKTVALPHNSEDCWDCTGCVMSAIENQGYLTRK